MPKVSAGFLIHKMVETELVVLLAHPGGPFWAKKDVGAWSIPKGGVEEGEDLLKAAHRELAEETGFVVTGQPSSLGKIRQSGRKAVYAWSVMSDVDTSEFRSSTIDLEWPRGSGIMHSFPEIDRVQWFDIVEARRQIHPAQRPFLDRLASSFDIEF